MREGSVVRSLAGRDKGLWLMVTAVREPFAWVANGRQRPLARPKRKRLLHLAPTSACLAVSEITSDRRLREALRGFAQPAAQGEGRS